MQRISLIQLSILTHYPNSNNSGSGSFVPNQDNQKCICSVKKNKSY